MTYIVETPFLYTDSGSIYYINDPINATPRDLYILSIPSASTTDYIWGVTPTEYPKPIKLTWSTNLQKFLLAGNTIGNPSATAMYSSIDGKNWVSSSTLIQGETSRIVCADELNLCVSSIQMKSTHSLIYTTNGSTWLYGTSSVPVQVKEVAWSSDINKFVGVGISGSSNKNIVVTSSNGINWQVFPNAPSASGTFECITWYSSSAKFVSVGNQSNNQSSSVYTTSNGEVWESSAEVNTSTLWKTLFVSKSVIYAGGIGGSGTNSNITESLMTSSNLTDWSIVATPLQSIYDIAYSNKSDIYVAVGQQPNDIHTPVVMTASYAYQWQSSSFPVTRLYDTSSNYTRTVAWSDTLSTFIVLAGNESYYLEDESVWLKKTEARTAILAINVPTTKSLYNNPFIPWTSSKAEFREDPQTKAWIKFNLARGLSSPNVSSLDVYYVASNGLGIIIDSSSLSQFSSSVTPNLVDTEINGIRYLREVSGKPIGYVSAYFETPTTINISSKHTSVFTSSFKADGRYYVHMLYGVTGSYTNDEVGLILNLDNGSIEYQEDATNYNAPSSYHMTSGSNLLRFISGPTLTEKSDGYWELKFKVGFTFNNNIGMSGSLNLTEI